MKLLPQDKRGFLALPVLVWIPIAMIRIVGFQAEKSSDTMIPTLRNMGIITLILVVMATFAIRWKPRR